MDFSMRRVNALFKKELKDVLKNTNIFIMVLLPLVICFLYSKVFGSISGKLDGKSSSLFVLDLSVNMNLILVSAFVIAMLIAEEKEKNTLRTLMLSAVTPMEFFAGKALLTLFMTVVTNVIMFFILSIELRHLPLYIGITTLCSLSMIAFGALIGILAKNQMATGALGMPLYFGFLLIPMFAPLSKVFQKIALALPTYNLSLVLDRQIGGKMFMSSTLAFNVAVISAWVLLGGVAFGYAYKRKGMDH